MRGARRLFPLYFVAMAIIVVGSHAFGDHFFWQQVPAMLYGTNIVFAAFPTLVLFPHFDYQHFWSLALEEQFYSAWPLAVFFLPRRRPLIKLCIAGIVVAFALRLAATCLYLTPLVAFAQLPTRMDSLLVGAWISLALRGPNAARYLDRVVLYCAFAGGGRFSPQSGTTRELTSFRPLS